MGDIETEAAAAADGGVEDLRRQLEHERRELAAAVGELERAVAAGRRRLGARRFAIVGGALLASFVLAGGVSALVRGAVRRRRLRRLRPHDRVVVRVGDLALVRRSD